MSKNLTSKSELLNWRHHNGETLRLLRENLGVTQAELASILGVSRATVIGVESRIDPAKLSTLWKIAIRDMLNRPYEYFPSIDGRLLSNPNFSNGSQHD